MSRTFSPQPTATAPVITLTTDFGLLDAYVGVMKGVIAGIAPEARVVDICHAVTPYAIPEGGFVLHQAWRYFPQGSIHVVVVDPGVGTERRALLVETLGHTFIGPDNGVFSMVFREASKAGSEVCVRVIENPEWMLPERSGTFDGRDVFSPAAAWLAAGRPAEECGPVVQDALKQNWDQPLRTGKRFWSGQVLKADHFGNLISNFTVDEFPLRDDKFELQAGVETIGALRSSYAAAGFGELFVIAGSSGFWEISLNQGSAARKLGLQSGSPLELVLLP
jgi:S-adenosylmethionine hydrolase